MTSTAAGARRRRREMPLAAQLIELRRRGLVAVLAVLVGAVGGWFLADPVVAALRAPIVAAARAQHVLADLNYDSLTGAFDLRIQIAVVLGLVLSSPVWLFQLWAFLLPAMTRREKRYTLGFFASAVPLFLAGCAAGWLLLPHMVALLTTFVPQGATSFIRAGDYVSFVVKLSLAVGIAFVLPVFVVLLNLVGVVSARAIRRSWRIAILAIALFSAIATPSADVVSMLLLAVPMVALYLAAATIATLHDRRRDRAVTRLVSGSIEGA